jgi:hypothetical protein
MPPEAGLRAVGLAMVAAALAYLALCRFSRKRRMTWRTRTLALPSGRLAALQALAGGANWLLIGAIAWIVLGGRIDYASVLGTMLLAAVAGVVTHVPANLGVLEAVVVATLGARLPAHELLAAMLAFRATYYLLPLAVALPAYGLSEAAARRAGPVLQPRAVLESTAPCVGPLASPASAPASTDGRMVETLTPSGGSKRCLNDHGRGAFNGLKGFGAPLAPSTLPATSRPYIESSVAWKSFRVPCTLPV